MRNTNNIPIGSVVVDDVHACLATIENQYTISISSDQREIYNYFINLFAYDLKNQSESDYSDIVNCLNPYKKMLIPFWAWQEKYNEIYDVLVKSRDEEFLKFSFPLIKDNLNLCNCMISSSGIEISPKCIPINKISSFINAERRIFMSATLSNDSVFIKALDLKPADIHTIITPEKANDIGDRLILFPYLINKRINDTEIKQELKKLSLKHNVVVIVPSYKRSNFWKDVADLILSSEKMNLIRTLKVNHIGLVVIINKYDGVDLPDDACRILVIDGLPINRSYYDYFLQNVIPKENLLVSEQIEKIEQGMGRAVRSNSDYCTVILMGRILADILYNSNGLTHFSEATRVQYELSEQLWEQVKGQDLEEIFKLIDYSLDRDIDWITVSKNELSNVYYRTNPNFNSVSVSIRQAFNLAEIGQYYDAVEVLTNERNKNHSPEVKGLLKQYIAEYTNFYNPVEAQQILLSGLSDNRMILKPLKGIQYDKVLNKTGSQSDFLLKYLNESRLTPNQYIIRINSLIEQLQFITSTSSEFEFALKEISFLIGIYSTRPEKEANRGPDNFWDLGDSNFLVIECKNESTTDIISKSDCNQLNGSINWFKDVYGSHAVRCYPLLIHNSSIFEFSSSPDNNIVIMTPDLLEKFKKNVVNFANSVIKPDIYTNSVEIHKLLTHFNLLGVSIIKKYTKSFKISKN